MSAYCLMAMKRGQTKPTLIAAQQDAYWKVLPHRDHASADATSYHAGIGPLLRPHDWLFWIERADQPAWVV